MNARNGMWLGRPLANNKPIGRNIPHNFFKVSSMKTKYQKPVDMFRDKDRDGVANVFDCKPNNKNKQGFVDALVGAAKGLVKGTGVKSGWRSGMAKPGNVATRAYVARREKKRFTPENYENYLAEKREYQATVSKKEMQAKFDEGKRKLRREKAQARLQSIPGSSIIEKLQGKIQKAQPGYEQYAKKKYLESRLKAKYPKLSDTQRAKIEHQIAKLARSRSGVVAKFRTRAVQLAVPIPSLSSYGSGDKTISGVKGAGRGRPRGSLDKRYAAYGGVYGYRRYMAQQKKVLKDKLKQQMEQIKAETPSAQPQYETQAYVGQEQAIPQELQGQSITPEYSQFQEVVEQAPPVPQPQQQFQQVPVQQMPQQMQVPNQYSQQAQKRPIGTVFKSSGGSPYPPVNSQSLAPTSQTIPYGYVESVDTMTGRRFLKQLPKTERWAGGQQ